MASNAANSRRDVCLRCVDCGVEFVFSAGEQAYFEQRGFKTRQRCRPCARTRREALQAAGLARPPRSIE